MVTRDRERWFTPDQPDTIWEAADNTTAMLAAGGGLDQIGREIVDLRWLGCTLVVRSVSCLVSTSGVLFVRVSGRLLVLLMEALREGLLGEAGHEGLVEFIRPGQGRIGQAC